MGGASRTGFTYSPYLPLTYPLLTPYLSLTYPLLIPYLPLTYPLSIAQGSVGKIMNFKL